MDIHLLQQTAQKMLAPGKGILAIDESHSTCKKHFEALGVECEEESRREYRELLITAPSLETAVSGLILFDETLRQSTADGRRFVDVLSERGMLAGIKVDTGAKELALHAGEMVTEGLDGLRERLAEYKSLGARFAKWRSVINISEFLPSLAAVKANAHGLARFAALCQEADLVPMVEPEMMMDGSHSSERCYEVTVEVLKVLFSELREQGVALEALILKVNMVMPGKDSLTQALPEEVARQTLRCLKENVPLNTGGVVFLSGGQSDEKSTIHLNLMHQQVQASGETLPWPLSFSYGRGIQGPALKAWAANRSQVAEAQQLLVHRARMNGLAAQGKYSVELEGAL